MDLNILTYLGIMLLAALIAGKIVKQMRLPNVTGNLVIGLLIGPNCLKILSEELIDSELMIHRSYSSRWIRREITARF